MWGEGKNVEREPALVPRWDGPQAVAPVVDAKLEPQGKISEKDCERPEMGNPVAGKTQRELKKMGQVEKRCWKRRVEPLFGKVSVQFPSNFS